MNEKLNEADKKEIAGMINLRINKLKFDCLEKKFKDIEVRLTKLETP